MGSRSHRHNIAHNIAAQSGPSTLSQHTATAYGFNTSKPHTDGDRPGTRVMPETEYLLQWVRRLELVPSRFRRPLPPYPTLK